MEQQYDIRVSSSHGGSSKSQISSSNRPMNTDSKQIPSAAMCIYTLPSRKGVRSDLFPFD